MGSVQKMFTPTPLYYVPVGMHAASKIEQILSNSCHDHHMRYYLTISHALPMVYNNNIITLNQKVFVIIILLFEHKIQCPYIIHNDSILCMCE